MHKHTLTYFGIALGIAVLVTASFLFNLFAGPERFLEDLLMSPRAVDPRITIVSIDSESLQNIGAWPWPRAVFAKAFSNLNAAAPKAVALDVIMADASRSGAADDAALKNALLHVTYPLVLPVEGGTLLLEKNAPPEASELITPLQSFLAAPNVSLAHVNLVLDADGVARNVPLEIRNGEQAFPSLARAALQKAGVHIEGRNSLERIVYAAPPGGIREIPFSRFLEDNPPDLSGDIVFIGVTSPDLHDEKPTPLSRGTEMPGIEIQANIANMLLQGYRLASPPVWLEVLYILFLALLPAFFFSRFRNSLSPLIASLVLGAGIVFLDAVLFDQGVLLNIIHTTLACLLSAGVLLAYRYFREEREKRELREVFSKYVAGDVLSEIMKNPKAVVLGGEEKEITVLFSDIRGFTTLSEKVTPKELVRILNIYFTAMTEEILKNKGVLDKYIGDAIMAFWGAPLDDADQAEHALQAAAGMMRRLAEVNAGLEANGDPTIAIGIGIYTGPAVVGNIGSRERFDYTAMGDTVNVASRLEGLNKEHKTTLIIGESTRQKLKNDWQTELLGDVHVKGRNEEVKIYTVRNII